MSYYYGLNLLFMQLFLKILSGMTNSVDPDQTAHSGAFCQTLWCSKYYDIYCSCIDRPKLRGLDQSQGIAASVQGLHNLSLI